MIMKKKFCLFFCAFLLSVLFLPNYTYAEECTEHQWSEWYTFDSATCSTDGSMYRICEICHKRENQIIPATGQHDWSEWFTIEEPTCVDTGLKQRRCSMCRQTEVFEIPKTDYHNWDDWETEQRATALSTGTKIRECLNCDATETKVIPKLKAKVSLVKKSVTVQKGKSYTLKIKSKTYGDKTTKWSSSNKKIVTVNSKGKVTGKKIGTATITLKMKSGAKSSCKVKVIKAKINNDKPDSNDDDDEHPSSEYVWIPKTGSKYHKTSTCSGMKSPRRVTLQEAKKRGYKPCSKCY